MLTDSSLADVGGTARPRKGRRRSFRKSSLLDEQRLELFIKFRMESRNENSIPILTLDFNLNDDDHRFSLIDHFQDQFPSSSSSEHDTNFLVANTPPYSPVVGNSFSFFPRSPTQTMPNRRRHWRFSRIIFNYAKYCLGFAMLITCLLLLETQSSDADANLSQDPRPHGDEEVDPKSPVSENTKSINRFPRFRRALSIQSDQNIVRDGPLFDLGDGYAASKGDDVLITVKTSKKYHVSRLNDVIDTWFRLAPEQIYFITDADDENLNLRTGGRLIPTTCPAGHHRQALCCKQSVEYQTYLKHGRSWWCHFDDDNYVNVPQLMRTLSQYDPREDWYLGKPSTKGPIETPYRDYGPESDTLASSERISFWFATGGAGFCLSKSLATKMMPYAADDKFVALCDRIRLPDDVTIGFLIEVLLEKNLTVVPRFHSHLESMRSIDVDRLHEQVTLSAGSYDGRDRNLVNVDRFFPDADDPRRFRSLHCHLYPMAAVCRSRTQNAK